MSSVYETCTKEKTISYEQDVITINLEEIYKYLALKTNKLYKTIESDIRYSFYNINIKKLSQNYINIFQLEFSFEFLNLKNLILDFMDIIKQ